MAHMRLPWQPHASFEAAAPGARGVTDFFGLDDFAPPARLPPFFALPFDGGADFESATVDATTSGAGAAGGAGASAAGSLATA